MCKYEAYFNFGQYDDEIVSFNRANRCYQWVLVLQWKCRHLFKGILKLVLTYIFSTRDEGCFVSI
jgi:hypothetical protein